MRESSSGRSAKDPISQRRELGPSGFAGSSSIVESFVGPKWPQLLGRGVMGRPIQRQAWRERSTLRISGTSRPRVLGSRDTIKFVPSNTVFRLVQRFSWKVDWTAFGAKDP